jgi:hypothetical protein
LLGVDGVGLGRFTTTPSPLAAPVRGCLLTSRERIPLVASLSDLCLLMAFGVLSYPFRLDAAFPVLLWVLVSGGAGLV